MKKRQHFLIEKLCKFQDVSGAILQAPECLGSIQNVDLEKSTLVFGYVPDGSATISLAEFGRLVALGCLTPYRYSGGGCSDGPRH